MLQSTENRAQLSRVFDQARVGIMHKRCGGPVLMVNSRFCEILGRSECEVRSLTFREYTHPDDLPGNLILFENGIRTGESFQLEKRYLRPDGSCVWCEVNVSFVPDSTGRSDTMVIVAQDISARKEAEAELAEKGSLLQNVVDSVDDLIFVKDLNGTFILANRALNEGCGELVGSKTTDFFDDDLTPAYEAVDAEVIASRATRTVEEIIPVHGERRLFQTVKVPWVRDGHVTGVIGVSRDVTEQKAAEAALRQSELLYRSVLEASADCIAIVDLAGRVKLMNTPGQTALGVRNFTRISEKPWADLWPKHTKAAVENALAEARQGRLARFSGSTTSRTGQVKWWDVLVTPMSDEAGTVINILAICRDITSQRQAAEQLHWASEHDALTALPNRRAFHARLQAATLRAMNSGGSVGLLLLDLDHFKHVNDSLGHSAGDHLLEQCGVRLKANVRGRDFVARLGGDEFAVIIESDQRMPDLVARSRTILRRLTKPIEYKERALTFGASVGGAIFPNDAGTAHELFNNADAALYALKESGRGGTKMFHQHMREHAQRVASQLRLAREVVTERSVQPHYQPKVDLLSGQIRGFEALLRWNHPTRGLQMPDTVAEAFKDYELSSRIGELMQRRVFSDLRDWARKGLSAGVLAINAAPAEFLRDDYAEGLLGRMEEYDIPPERVEIEVTEHVFFERGSEYVSRALQRLNAAGVRIALDDFGTGYSSLSHLRDFPVDLVKIDQSFVAQMSNDEEIRAIVSAVVQLARSLKIEVVAEGIETEQQRSQLLEQGCHFGQGHLFGRAVCARDVSNLLKGAGLKAAA